MRAMAGGDSASVRVVGVELGPQRYDIVIGKALASEAVAGLRSVGLEPPRRLMLAVDANLERSRVDAWASTLEAAGYEISRHALVAEERAKSMAELEGLLVAMARAKLERRDGLMAIGGGVVGDLAGFAAATYQRGVRWVQVPTTLLSMVDASVGGKTGVNLSVGGVDGGGSGGEKKNYVGAFHQPSLVLADVEWLSTLPARHLRAGLAECLKHGLLSGEFGDPELWEWTCQVLPRVRAIDQAALAELVARNVAVKARVVEFDSHETRADGGRALLNLGHTFGHAIEPMPNLSPDGRREHAPLHHGEAVALGLIAAANAGVAMGVTPVDLADRIRSGVALAGFPTTIAGLPPNGALLGLMSHDKKVSQGRLRLIVPVAQGRCAVVTDPDERAVMAGWDAIRAAGPSLA